jgi:hypothetical protein
VARNLFAWFCDAVHKIEILLKIIRKNIACLGFYKFLPEGGGELGSNKLIEITATLFFRG